MAISIDDIKKLRAMTGAGLANCSVSVDLPSLLSVATVRHLMVVYSLRLLTALPLHSP